MELINSDRLIGMWEERWKHYKAFPPSDKTADEVIEECIVELSEEIAQVMALHGDVSGI